MAVALQSPMRLPLRMADALEVNPSSLFMPLNRTPDKRELVEQIRELLDRLSERISD